MYGLLVQTGLTGFSAVAGGVALALLMLPTIIRTTDDALQLLPEDLRWASLGAGASDYETVLRSLNRLNDVVDGFRLDGQVLYHGRDLYDPRIDPIEVRRRIGMVFQRPNSFPKSIFDNVAYAARVMWKEQHSHPGNPAQTA